MNDSEDSPKEKPNCDDSNDDGSKNCNHNAKHVTPYLVYCLIICSIGCTMQIGFNTSIYNTPVKIFKEFFNETYYHQHSKVMSESTWALLWGITNGLFPLGGMLGATVSGHLADLFGRKQLILMINGLVLIAGVTTIMSKFVYSCIPFIIGRFITGIYCGLFSGVAPLYLTEIAPKSIRGAAGTLFQLALVLGMLLTNILGLPKIFGNKELWPCLVGFTLLPSAVLLICFPSCVETPKFVFISLNEFLRTIEILKKLRGLHNEELIITEMEELSNEKSLCLTETRVSYKTLFMKSNFKRPLLIALVITIAMNFCGISSISIYSTSMFINIGLDASTWAVYGTIIISIFKLLVTVLSAYLVDQVGRRILLITGFLGMTFYSFCLAIVPAIDTQNNLFKYLTIAIAVLYVMSFSIGPGTISNFITTELFTSDARGKAMSVIGLVNWLSFFIVTTSIPPIMESIHNYIYLIFGVLTLLFVAFIYMKLPETKNKSIEEISQLFY